MPISASTKKSLRKSIKNRKSNTLLKNKIKLVVKTFLSKPSEKGLAETFSALDKGKKRGLIHKNKVSRLKSQYSKKIASGEKVAAGKSVTKKAVKKTVKKVSKKTTKKMS